MLRWYQRAKKYIKSATLRDEAPGYVGSGRAGLERKIKGRDGAVLQRAEDVMEEHWEEATEAWKSGHRE